MTGEECIKLIEDAVSRLYPDLSENGTFSSSDVVMQNKHPDKAFVWIEYEKVRVTYLFKQMRNLALFNKPFEDWAKEQNFTDPAVLGDSDTRTIIFEVVAPITK
jgi:hypothetical protein